MRCLTLAAALTSRGVRCTFAVDGFGRALVERFGSEDVTVVDSDLSTMVAQTRYDFVILDDYAIEAAQEETLRRLAGAVIALDDLADRDHAADLLIDPSYGRTSADYDQRAPARTVRLVGQEMALLRPEFSAVRTAALARPVGPEPNRLFLSFGLSDIDAVAARATTLIRQVSPTVQIDVALSSTAQSAAILRRRMSTDPALSVHFDAVGVAKLMAFADVAIGAGGVSTWERCCLGTPTLAVVVADNQRAMIRRLAADGILLAVDLALAGFEADFLAALRRVWGQTLRQSLKARAAKVCDGLGAERVADAILAL